MSEREQDKMMVDAIPESAIRYVIGYMQRLCESLNIPNAETAAAMKEVNEMIQTGKGQHFEGSTEDFFAMLDAEDDSDVGP